MRDEAPFAECACTTSRYVCSGKALAFPPSLLLFKKLIIYLFMVARLRCCTQGLPLGPLGLLSGCSARPTAVASLDAEPGLKESWLCMTRVLESGLTSCGTWA